MVTSFFLGMIVFIMFPMPINTTKKVKILPKTGNNFITWYKTVNIAINTINLKVSFIFIVSLYFSAHKLDKITIILLEAIIINIKYNASKTKDNLKVKLEVSKINDIIGVINNPNKPYRIYFPIFLVNSVCSVIILQFIHL